MTILPAIDIYGGKVVRLYQGDYDRMTVYSDDPLAVAAAFREAGAEYIHIVDLEGARSGAAPNFPLISRIAAESGLKLEVGGGIRDEDTAERYLGAGVERVVLGTAAVTDPIFLMKMTVRYAEHIAVGADIKDGFVAIRGWTESSGRTCDDFFGELRDMGVQTVICTDVSRDGAMGGTNRALYSRLSAAYPVRIIASGGVSTLDDVRALRDMGLYGAIIGKAYYTGAIDLRKAIEAAK